MGALLYRLPANVIAILLAVALIGALLGASYLGRRAVAHGWHGDLGALETMASGLLGLLLAFNFSMAQGRFDARQHVIVEEANAIGTTYLRCSVFPQHDDRQHCRDLLRRYTNLRIVAYRAYSRSEDNSVVLGYLAEGEAIQRELWTRVSRIVRESPNTGDALLMSSLNQVIDLDTERRASLRVTVPLAVSLAIVFACVAWALLLGYASGAKEDTARTGWIMVALVISVVFGVAVDFDRPRSGFITTQAAEKSMTDLLSSMETPPAD